jgi:hypothetical protein
MNKSDWEAEEWMLGCDCSCINVATQIWQMSSLILNQGFLSDGSYFVIGHKIGPIYHLGYISNGKYGSLLFNFFLVETGQLK